jgi:hypothetical protein
MLRPILLVKIGLGGLVFAARWGQSSNGQSSNRQSGNRPRGDEASEEPGDFLRRHLQYELSGAFARSWDELHPGHQQVVTRERYAECRAQLFERSGPATELRSFEVVDVTDDPTPIAGVPEPSSKAVTAEITIGLNGDSRTALDTLHAVHVDGRWTWVFPESVYRAYASGSSPAATS